MGNFSFLIETYLTHCRRERYVPNGRHRRGDFSSRWTRIRAPRQRRRCPGIDQGLSRSAKIAGPFVIVGGIPRRLPIGEISKSASNVGSSALLRGEGSIAGKVGQSRLSLPLNVPR